MAELGFSILGTGFSVSPTTIVYNLINIAQQIKKQTPTLEDEVTVEVIGQPGANKQQLYYLAMASAFGIVRQHQIINALLAFVTPSYGMLMSEDDAADNWVRCTVRYEVGMYGAVSTAAVQKLFGVPSGFGGVGVSIFDQLTIYRGPQCSVNGGNFNFISTPIVATGTGILDVLSGSIPGIPTNATSPAAPKLPFRNQPIITPCPTTVTPLPQSVKENPAPSFPTTLVGAVISSPNPKPPGDNRSRGAVITPGTSVPSSGTSTSSSSSSGSTTNIPGYQGSCCAINLSLIPLVFAALSAPATNSDMTFPNPTQGPTGN